MYSILGVFSDSNKAKVDIIILNISLLSSLVY